MGRTVAVLNQKGGVGKTTVTLGLTSAAATAGHRVLVVDLDPQGSSSWVLGVDPREVEDSIAEVLGRAPVSRVMQQSDWSENVWVLPSSPRLLPKDHGGNPDPRIRDGDRYQRYAHDECSHAHADTPHACRGEVTLIEREPRQ